MWAFISGQNSYDDGCLVDIKLREYILDDRKLPPAEMSLLYWFYPYTTIALMRDIVVQSFKAYNVPKGMISIMSSFPIAYILSTEKEEQCGLFDLFKYCSSDIDAVVKIPIDCSSCYFSNTRNLRSPFWPCNVTNDDDGVAFVLGNETMMNDSKIANQSMKNMKDIRK